MFASDESGEWVARLDQGRLEMFRQGQRVADVTLPVATYGAQLALLPEQLLLLLGELGELWVFDHSLQPLHKLATGPACRLLATSGSVALFRTGELDAALFSTARAADGLVRVTGPIKELSYACGDSDGQFYVGRASRLSRWSLSPPRLLASFRVVLDFEPSDVGVSWDGRFLWFARAGRPCEVFRTSDWMRRQPLPAAAELRHCRRSRYVAMRGSDGWSVVDIATGREASRLPAEARDVCVLPSASPLPRLLVERESGELEWPSAPAAPAPVVPPPMVATAAAAVAAFTPASEAPQGAAPDRPSLSKWRAGLFGRAAATPATSVTPVTAPPTTAPPTTSSPAPAPSAAAPSAAAPSAPAPTEQSDWRQRLVAWRGGREEPPPLEGELGGLCQRLAIAAPAARGLAYLYRRRLLGLLPPSPAQLALAIGGADGWREALGQGELARLRLVRASEARPSLCATTRRLLDGEGELKESRARALPSRSWRFRRRHVRATAAAKS